MPLSSQHAQNLCGQMPVTTGNKILVLKTETANIPQNAVYFLCSKIKGK